MQRSSSQRGKTAAPLRHNQTPLFFSPAYFGTVKVIERKTSSAAAVVLNKFIPLGFAAFRCFLEGSQYFLDFFPQWSHWKKFSLFFFASFSPKNEEVKLVGMNIWSRPPFLASSCV